MTNWLARAPAWLCAVGLLAAAVALLAAGGFIEFGAESKSAPRTEWAPSFILASATSLAAILVAIGIRSARYPLGAAVGALTLALIWMRHIEEEFRFIWRADQGQLVVFLCVLAWLALAMFATGGGEPPRERLDAPRVPLWARLLGHAVVTALGMLGGFSIGIAYFERNACLGGDCELGYLWGISGAFFGFLAGIGIGVLYEFARASRGKLTPWR